MRTIHEETGKRVELNELEAKQGLPGRRLAVILSISPALEWVILSVLQLGWSQQHEAHCAASVSLR